MLLSERQERVLKSVVNIYIATARPVSSTALLSVSGLGVSSATVRNEMGVLEDLGYVRQLHTSGGRVPTNAGYRYYVERLMNMGRVSDSDARTIRHQFHQVHTEVQEWLKLAATIMASRMHNVGLITAPKSTEVRLRHVELLSIQPRVALLIVVVQDGSVLQEMISLAEPHTQEELGSLSRGLNDVLQGLTVAVADVRLFELTHVDASITPMISHLLRRCDEQHTQVFHAGLADMIRQPEFTDLRPGEPLSSLNQRLGQMVEFLQRGFVVDRLLSEIQPAAQIQIVIGSDDTVELRDYSFVLGRYGDELEGSGVLGVIGPTRMEYPRAVALVRYMSEVMTDLMQAY
ncbi:MAG: heat-inducible transcriptional repressor HrcA [Chloroflexota bacterium]